MIPSPDGIALTYAVGDCDDNVHTLAIHVYGFCIPIYLLSLHGSSVSLQATEVE